MLHANASTLKGSNNNKKTYITRRMANVGFTCKRGPRSGQGARLAPASRVTGAIGRCKRVLYDRYHLLWIFHSSCNSRCPHILKVRGGILIYCYASKKCNSVKKYGRRRGRIVINDRLEMDLIQPLFFISLPARGIGRLNNHWN